MPSVHIQMSVENDNIQQTKQSLITIPGSYWFYHRKNVYKFTFKYCRAFKAEKQFDYTRELMKIIRRIIKCQPKQGQQFETKHLLVTYNHTSWTRQDKMFAMLKFSERTNVSAFSRAFVLTIKIISSPERLLANTGYAVTLQDSSLLNLDDKNDVSIINKEDSLSSKLDDQIFGSDIQRSSTGTVSTMKIESLVTEMSKNDSMYTNRINDINLLDDKSELSKSFNCAIKNELISVSPKSQRIVNNPLISENNLCSGKEFSVDNSNHDTNDRLRSRRSTENMSLHEDNIKTDNIEDIDDNQSIVETDDASLDSANMPYQYLIEKEIESCKEKNIFNPSILNEEKRVDSLNKESNKKVDNAKYKVSKIDRRKQKLKELDKKVLLEENYLRSSNITDQVMEGLMFTIRKDQDTVSVLEQKTKLEVDEVLENSEKVETKEGEKCLVNSSLLRLENLITKIEFSGAKRRKTDNILDKRKDSELCFTGNSHNFLKNLNTIDNYICSKEYPIISDYRNNKAIHVENKRNYFDKDLQGDEKMEFGDFENEEDEDEDIVPEAFQCNISSNDSSSSYLDMLIADIETKESVQNNYMEMLQKGASSLQNHCKTLVEDVCLSNKTNFQSKSKLKAPNNSNGSKSKVPKITSDKIINTNEIPPALQEIIKYSCFKRNAIMASTVSETDKGNINEPQPSTSKEKSVHRGTIVGNNNKTTDILMDSSSTISSALKTHNQIKSELSLVYKTDLGIRKRDNSIVNKKYLTKGTTYVLNKDFVLPSKLQDITEDFFNEMLQQQKKNANHSQRSLRQRKSINTKELKNSEIRIEMLKFIQDITRGAKVVVQRMSTKSISNILGKSSSTTTCMN
ncbi:putative leucine-rich repeat-containing protein DDB_G0290503 [Prorops nasuta]|uniref:putative leucine-rich repeat-containing protein DDB_G0290503 n=1 Tax=Prorops nasuta TaxID=863751 RepID=UPI0034CE52FB